MDSDGIEHYPPAHRCDQSEIQNSINLKDFAELFYLNDLYAKLDMALRRVESLHIVSGDRWYTVSRLLVMKPSRDLVMS